MKNFTKINNTWISVKDKLPAAEVEVLVYTKGKIITTAIYEDGTIREENSEWHWNEPEYWNDTNYDEENDCYIIPEGWWEYRHYNPDDVYNNPIDDEVLFWQPLPQRPILLLNLLKMLKKNFAKAKKNFANSLYAQNLKCVKECQAWFRGEEKEPCSAATEDKARA